MEINLYGKVQKSQYERFVSEISQYDLDTLLSNKKLDMDGCSYDITLNNLENSDLGIYQLGFECNKIQVFIVLVDEYGDYGEDMIVVNVEEDSELGEFPKFEDVI